MAPAAVTPVVRAMEIGQHVIAAALTIIGVIRAIGTGTPLLTAVIAGIAILAWHTAGTMLPAQTGSQKVVAWWLGGFAVIWVTAVAVSSEFVWVAFLLWLLAGHLLPITWGLVYFALVLVVVIVAPLLHHGMTTYANVFGPLIGGIFAFGIARGYLQLLRDGAERERLVASLTDTQREMAGLLDELAQAQRESGAVAERTRISRDIHDTIAQALSSIRLLAHAGGVRTNDSDAARTLKQIETLAGESLADVRRIISALVPAELEGKALAAALGGMLERLGEETGINVELHVDESVPALGPQVEVALLRTTQSALANVRIHAQATKVVMSLIDSGANVRLDLIDDGVGFASSAWEQADEPDPGSPGHGLRFMRARLRELGGGLDIESTPGAGTAISMHLPIHLGTPPGAPGQEPITKVER